MFPDKLKLPPTTTTATAYHCWAAAYDDNVQCFKIKLLSHGA